MTLMTACYSHQVLDETSIYSVSHQACWPDTQRDFSAASLPLVAHRVGHLVWLDEEATTPAAYEGLVNYWCQVVAPKS
jgi:hypothetical protein